MYSTIFLYGFFFRGKSLILVYVCPDCYPHWCFEFAVRSISSHCIHKGYIWWRRDRNAKMTCNVYILYIPNVHLSRGRCPNDQNERKVFDCSKSSMWVESVFASFTFFRCSSNKISFIISLNYVWHWQSTTFFTNGISLSPTPTSIPWD